MSENIQTLIKQIATSLGVKDGAFKMWKSRKAIPFKYQIQIVEKSNELRTPITLDQLKNPF